MNNPDYKHKLPRFTVPRTGDLEHGCKCNTVSNAQGRGKKVKIRYSLSLSLSSLSLLSKAELHRGYNSDLASRNYMEMQLDGDKNSKL